MAEVQLARLRGAMGFEKLVVVKLVHEHLASQKSFVEMLMQEARLAALVKHPNVVDIYDLGESEGRYFVAMEYLAGEPMLALLRAGRDGKRLDPLSSARLIAEVAEGLTAAHTLRSMAGEAMPLVHHDVSLGNIMVLYTGQAKLVDFGVAKAGDKAHDADKDRIKGKFGYMAPEKLRGEGGDARSDIFSLGVVLWEALTLRRLFRANNDLEAIQQILEDPILPPSEVNGEVPKAFDRICLKALERDVSKRYQSAAELARDIEGVLREAAYTGKYEAIAAYMQETFAEHICARSQLIKEAATAHGPSAQLDELVSAAFSPSDRGASSPGIAVAPPELPERAVASAAAEAVRGRLGKGKAALAAADEATMQSPVIDAEAEAEAARRAEAAKAAEAKRAAEEQAAEVKRAAEAKAAEVRKAAEAKAAEVRKAAEAKKAALAAAAESTATEVVADVAGKAAAAAAEVRRAAKKAAEQAGGASQTKNDAQSETKSETKNDAQLDAALAPTSGEISAAMSAAADAKSAAAGATRADAKREAAPDAEPKSEVPAPATPSLAAWLAGSSLPDGGGAAEATFEPSQKPLSEDAAEATPKKKPATATDVAAPVLPTSSTEHRSAMWADQEPSVTELSPQWSMGEASVTEVSPSAGRSLIPSIPKILPSRQRPVSEGESTEVSAAPVDLTRDPALLAMGQPRPTPHLGQLLASVLPGNRAASGNHLGPAAGVIHAPEQPEPPPGSTTGNHPTRAMGTRSGTDTGGRDVLGGWGWTTGANGAIAGDEITGSRLAERRRNRWLVGGAAGLIALIVIVAVAAGGEDGTGPAGTALSTARATGAAGAEDTSEQQTFVGASRPDQIALAPEAMPSGEAAAAAAASEVGDVVEPSEPTQKADAKDQPSPSDKGGERIEATPAQGKPSERPRDERDEKKSSRSEAEKSSRGEAEKSSRGEAEKSSRSEAEKSSRSEAEKSSRSEAEKKPEIDVEATFKTGQGEFLRGDAKAALATFRKLVAASPNYAPAWRGAGLAHERLGQKAAAAKALRRYLKLSPAAADAAQIKARLERLE